MWQHCRENLIFDRITRNIRGKSIYVILKNIRDCYNFCCSFRPTFQITFVNLMQYLKKVFKKEVDISLNPDNGMNNKQQRFSSAIILFLQYYYFFTLF